MHGRDSILVRLVPMAESSESAATSEPGRFSTENARLILFDSGSVTASLVAAHQKEARKVLRIVFDAGLENLGAVVVGRRLAGDAAAWRSRSSTSCFTLPAVS